eukprot:2668437-Pyramimonas_sp.AAC.1
MMDTDVAPRCTVHAYLRVAGANAGVSGPCAFSAATARSRRIAMDSTFRGSTSTATTYVFTTPAADSETVTECDPAGSGSVTPCPL